nr:proton pump-interactor 1-like [Ipomoea batatas]GMD19032.1 proton pump-interactor 1-like [Ipomoea batatas]
MHPKEPWQNICCFRWTLSRNIDNWNEVKAQVHRFSDNLYKSFASKEKAIQAFDNFVANQTGSSLNTGASSCSSQTTNTAKATSNSDEAKEILSHVQDELAREYHEHTLKVDAIIEEFKQMLSK